MDPYITLGIGVVALVILGASYYYIRKKKTIENNGKQSKTG